MQRNRVRLDRGLADEAHRQRRGGEDSDLGDDHHADRQAEPPEGRELGAGGTPRQGEQPQRSHAGIDQRGRHENGEHQRLRQGGGETRANDPEGGHAELAEDQRVIGERIERDGDKARDQRRTGAFERRKGRTRGKKQEARRQAPLESPEVDAGVPGDVRRLADGEKEWRRPSQNDPHDDGDENRGNERLVGRAPQRGRALPSADLCRGDGRQGGDDADSEQEQRLIEKEADRSGRERVRRKPSEHHEVGRRHHVDCDVGEDDRPAERERRAELAPEPAVGG